MTQVALSMVLLISAGLLTRALTVDTGFDATSVVAAQLNLAPHGYDSDQSRVLIDQLLEHVSADPEVSHTGRSSMQPLLGFSTQFMRPEGQQE